ncbi:MAG: hypothetical protein ABGZ53_26430 [Fuerstiella sp.]
MNSLLWEARIVRHQFDYTADTAANLALEATLWMTADKLRSNMERYQELLPVAFAVLQHVRT